MRKFRFIVTMAIVVAFSITLALLSRKLFMDKAEDKKLKDLITTEEPSGTGQSVTGSNVFQRNIDYLKELNKQNSDCIGWLKVSGCDIDYPVMYCKEDPEFYLHANFDKEYSGIGTPYVDGFCTPLGDKRSDNVIIYGHNISSGEMFHYLNRYEDEEFYQKHKYIQYDTLDGPGEYEVIAAFRYVAWSENDKEHYHFLEFRDAANENEFNEFVKNAQELTPFKTATAKYGDKLIMLSTCAYHTENGRFAVVAKKTD